MSWGAATDNVGVDGYRVERCEGNGCANFVKLATATSTTFSDLVGLVPNTIYRYVIRAADAASNLGPYSNIVNVTTLATNPQLVAAYSFEEGTGTTLTDVSGNGNTGTIVNATWTTTGKYGNALTFNGTSARVTVPDASSLDLTTGMTLEAWVKPSVVNTGWRDVIYKGNDIYYLEATSGNGGLPALSVKIGASSPNLYGASALTPNTWTHLAATYDGTILRLYVNGAQVSSLPQTGSITPSSSPLEIGGDSIYGQYFQGVIDEVRVYNVALTPTQIQADMNSPTGGAFPFVSLNPTSIDFGSLDTGTTSSPQTTVLTNTGTVTLYQLAVSA